VSANKTSNIRGAVEESRERLVALLLLLQRAWTYGALTQEEILRELKVDEYPVSAKGPKKIRAYQGTEGTVRQKFERDKVRIRDLGFHIETVTREDGSVAYRIDPASGYAPPLYFSEDEERVVKLALAFCGFGRSGAFSVFNEGPASDGGLAGSQYFTPVLRAVNLRRELTFEYLSATKKVRVVQPLVIDVFQGTTYLVARVGETGEIKGYRFSRMTSMPVVSATTFTVDDDTLAAAKSWRPVYAKALRPVDVVVSTNENYADLLRRQYPDAVAATKGSGKVDVGITFDGPRAALRFVLECADRVRLQSPKSLRDDLAAWLPQVNRGAVPDLATLHFDAASTTDVLGETLQLLHAVYASEDGLRISELARRFRLSPDHVRLIMDRLVSLEPMADAGDGTNRFPAHLIKECDDWDDEAHDDSTYRADFSDLGDDDAEPSPLMWRDVFELNVALREASRVYSDPAVLSAIEKIEAATRVPLQVETAQNEGTLARVESAIAAREQLTISYTSAESDQSQVRVIEPREIKVLNGHSYVRAFSVNRNEWRTFRIDRIVDVLSSSPTSEPRPVDDEENWLTRVGHDGDLVVVVLRPEQRWLFEPLPGAQWLTLSDGRLAVQFRVSDPIFLDHLMLCAGPGAVVATPQYAAAGHELARRISEHL